MPELPEAETLVRQIRPRLIGAILGPVRHLRADVIRSDMRGLRRRLLGRTVRDVVRRGKRIALELDDASRLVIGLGMSGHVSVAAAQDEVAKHTHLRLAVGDGSFELRFRDARRFGGLWLLNGEDDKNSAGFARLGPEPLSVGLREFRRIVDRERQIKALLMDQSALAGMGNIYCDESLFRARIHPQARAADLPPERVKCLHRAIRQVLNEAIAAEGSSVNSYMTADGGRGTFQYRLRVYGRTGEPCVKCNSEIKSMIAAGRTTHFCPACQAAP
jgi:formamidopyrimidine-DNA glycosylase